MQQDELAQGNVFGPLSSDFIFVASPFKK